MLWLRHLCELIQIADIVVGSEDVVPGVGFNYTFLSDMSEAIATEADANGPSAVDVASLVLHSFSTIKQRPLALSAVDKVFSAA